MKKAFSVLLCPILALCFILYVLSHPLECAFYTSTSLNTCAKSLVPTLFPFILGSRFLAQVMPPVKKSYIFTRFFAKLFGINENLVPCVLIGLFSGFPTGAVYVQQIYNRGLCNKREAIRAVALSNNCSAAFLMGAASITVFGSIKYGAVLVICQVIAIITTSQLLKLIFKTTYSKTNMCAFESLPETKTSLAFNECLKSSCLSMLYISGFVVFFNLVYSVICEKFSTLPIKAGPFLVSLLGATLELSTGIFSCSNLYFPLNVVTCAFCASFPSLSVIFQIKSICDDYFDITKEFIFSHICISLISSIFSCAFLVIFPNPDFFDYIIFSIPFLIVISCFTCFSMLKKDKKKCVKLPKV